LALGYYRVNGKPRLLSSYRSFVDGDACGECVAIFPSNRTSIRTSS
jgi:hypothetical protein